MNNSIAKLIELNQKGLLNDEDLAMAIREVNSDKRNLEKNKIDEKIKSLEAEIDNLNKEYENADSVKRTILENKFKEIDKQIQEYEKEKRTISREEISKKNRERSEQIRHNLDMYNQQEYSKQQFEKDKEFLRQQRNMYGERVYTDDTLDAMLYLEAAHIVSEIKEGLANADKDREEAKKGFSTVSEQDEKENPENKSKVVEDNKTNSSTTGNAGSGDGLSEEEKKTADSIEQTVEETKMQKFKKKVANIKTASANLWSKVKQNKGKVIGGLVALGLIGATIALGPGVIAAAGLGVAGAYGVHQISKGAKGK